MKNILLVILALSFHVGIAQPIITAQNMIPQIGDTFHYNVVNYLNVDINFHFNATDTGQGLVWDLSSLDTGSATSQFSSMRYQYDLASIPDSSFASVADISLTGEIDFFGNQLFAVDSNSFAFLGVTTPSVPATNFRRADARSNPRTIMQFPFSYGSSFHDSCRMSELETAGPTASDFEYWDYNINVRADGIGTLILADDTIYNVLKVRDYEAYNLGQDTSSPDQHSRNSNLSFSFYDGQTESFIAKLSLSRNWRPYFPFSQIEGDSGQLVLKVIQEVPQTQVSVLAVEEREEVQVYPNPSNGRLMLEKVTFEDQVELFDLSGKEISFQRVCFDSFCEIETEFSGIAILEIGHKGRKTVLKVVFR